MSDNPEETTYYLRIIAMYMELGTETVRKVFQYFVPGNDVAAFLTSPETRYKLFELHKNNILNNDEYNKVTVNRPDPKKFDIALLIRLLISLFGDVLPKPTLGWKKRLQPPNDSLGADLIRLRNIRNKLIAHRPNARLSKEDFERMWIKIEVVLSRISNHVEKNSSVEQKIRKYKETPLEPLETTIQAYLDIFKAWNKDIAKLQQQVEDLKNTTKEFHLYFKKPPERYVRYIKLLFEGGSLVMCSIMKRELDRSKTELDSCLRDNRESLYTLVESKQLRDQLFPPGICSSDPTKWDIWLLATVILTLFGSHISQVENDNIRVIKKARESYAEFALASLDVDQYLVIWTYLTSSLNKLSQNVDGETTRQVEIMIPKYMTRGQNVGTADTYFDQLSSNGVCVKTLEDIYKEHMNQLDTLMAEMTEKGIKLKTDHVFELKLETVCEDEEKKHAADDTLEVTCRAGIAGSETSTKYALVRRETDKLIWSINSISGVKIKTVLRECVLLEIRCLSFYGSCKFIRYALSKQFQTCLQNIRNELCHSYTEPMAVFGNVTLESLHKVLGDPYSSRDNQSVSGINIPITCSTAEGMQQVLALLNNEETTNSLNQIADQLSLQVDETVALKAFPLLNEFSSVFAETDSENSGSGNISNEEEAGDLVVGKESEEKDHVSNTCISSETDKTINLRETEVRGLEDEDILGDQNSFEEINQASLEIDPEKRLIKGRMSHEQCSSLSSSLSKNVNITNLIMDEMKCTNIKCEGHDIDLSKNEKLQRLTIQRCFNLSVYSVNPSSLESVEIRYSRLSHEGLLSLSSCISRAENLRELSLQSVECAISDCTDHFIDLTNNEKLQRLTINNCDTLSVNGVNSSLESVEIRYSHLSREGLLSLSSCISRAENLRELSLEFVSWANSDCTDHFIDLTNNEKLQRLTINNCDNLSVNGVNSSLESVEIRYSHLSREGLLSLSSCISRAENLRELSLRSVLFANSDWTDQLIDLTNNEKLQRRTIHDCHRLSMYGVNSSLESVEIRSLYPSHEGLLSLSSCISRAENLRELSLQSVEGTSSDCTDHFIDLANHEKLQRLTIHGCDTLSVYGVNSSLESVEIRYSHLSHKGLLSFLSFISRADNLKELSLQSVKCANSDCTDHFIDLTNNEKLQRLTINNCNTLSVYGVNSSLESVEIKYSHLSHEALLSLSSCISRAENLRELTLAYVKCANSDCTDHFIDLTNNEKLQRLTINLCDNLSVNGVNSSLESVEIGYSHLSHEGLLSLSSCISRADNLRELSLEFVSWANSDCTDHFIDLTNNEKLQRLTIHYCDTLSVYGVNSSLESVEIRFSHFSHEGLLSLSSCISRAENLRELSLRSVMCANSDCTEYFIDLTNNEKLQRLTINHCDTLSVYGVNSSLESVEIRYCHLSHEGLLSLSSCISRAENLKELSLESVKCANSDCTDHFIDLTNNDKLERLRLLSCDNLVLCDINLHLESCVISRSKVSHDFLLSLSSRHALAVNLKELELDNVKCTNTDCTDHVIDLSKNEKLTRSKIVRSLSRPQIYFTTK